MPTQLNLTSPVLHSDTVGTENGVSTPLFAIIHANNNGNNTIVSAVPGKKIRVLGVWLVSAGAVNVKFQSGTSGTDITGLAQLSTNSGFVLPVSTTGWFETSSGVLLNINLSSGTFVDGSLVYITV